MSTSLGVLVLGIVTGLQYALLGVGIVLTYKSARFVNFAHGQLGVISAVLLAKLGVEAGLSYWVALPVAILAAAVVGGLVERLVIRRLFDASRLIITIATIGVAQILFVSTLVGPLRVDAGRVLREGYPVPFQGQWQLGAVIIRSSQLLTLGVAPLIAAGLYFFFARTSIGKAIRGAASNPEAARLAGISVRRISLVVWILAGVLSGLTAVLLAPTQPTLDIAALGPSLLLRGFAAALIGKMTDLPTAFAGGVVLGVVEQVAYWNIPRGGTSDIAVLIVILIAILLRARGLSATSRRGDEQLTVERSRPKLDERLQKMHIARNLDRYGWALFGLLGLAFPFLPGMRSEGQSLLLGLIVTYAMVGLSLTVLTGWAGQASLGHFALLGVGAYAAAAADRAGFAVPAVLLVAAVVAAGTAVLIGLPALRFRGLFLGVTSLAFALAAQSWLFTRSWVGEDSAGNASVVNTHLPLMGPIRSQKALYYLAIVVLALIVVGLRNLRRTSIGRALISVRDNDRAASAHGLNATAIKITGLVLSGMIAGIAGGMWGMVEHRWTSLQFDGTLSLVMLSVAIVGGLNTLHGPILGALAVFAWPYLVPDANTFIVRSISSGALLLGIVLFLPGGIASLVDRARTKILNLLAGRVGDELDGVGEDAMPQPSISANFEFAKSNGFDGNGKPPLVVTEVSISFGGLKALQGVSLRVGAGEIVGLIGGNGAGKTTLMNCISGYLAPTGMVEIFGKEATATPSHSRPALGAARSFQDAHLFPGLTVGETVLVALDRTDPAGILGSAASTPWADLVEKNKRSKAQSVLSVFGLGDRERNLTGELSTGMRRLCDLATVTAENPRLVLLDEPTAGIAQREVEAFGPLLRRLRDELGWSILIVEHDVPLLMSLCDRVYALESGEVIASGTPEEVRSDPRVIASYLGTDVASIERSGGGAAPTAAGLKSEPPSAPKPKSLRAPKSPNTRTRKPPVAATPKRRSAPKPPTTPKLVIAAKQRPAPKLVIASKRASSKPRTTRSRAAHNGGRARKVRS